MSKAEMTTREKNRRETHDRERKENQLKNYKKEGYKLGWERQEVRGKYKRKERMEERRKVQCGKWW